MERPDYRSSHPQDAQDGYPEAEVVREGEVVLRVPRQVDAVRLV